MSSLIKGIFNKAVPLLSLTCSTNFNTQIRNFAARRGTREKKRALALKNKAAKASQPAYVPKKDKETSAQQYRIQKFDNRSKKQPVDDVYTYKYYAVKQYAFAEAIGCIRETHHPEMYNAPDAPVLVKVHLDFEAEKKTKTFANFHRMAPMPHAFDHGEARAVMAFAKTEESLEAAKAAGATLCGGTELIRRIQNGEIALTDFPHIIAHPEIMPELLVLRGLMKRKFPNPKSGTLDVDLGKSAANFVNGVSYSAIREPRETDFGIIDTTIGFLNMDTNHLEENFESLLLDINKARPKRPGTFIIRSFLTSPPSKERFKINLDKYLATEVESEADVTEDEVDKLESEYSSSVRQVPSDAVNLDKTIVLGNALVDLEKSALTAEFCSDTGMQVCKDVAYIANNFSVSRKITDLLAGKVEVAAPVCDQFPRNEDLSNIGNNYSISRKLNVDKTSNDYISSTDIEITQNSNLDNNYFVCDYSMARKLYEIKNGNFLASKNLVEEETSQSAKDHNHDLDITFVGENFSIKRKISSVSKNYLTKLKANDHKRDLTGHEKFKDFFGVEDAFHDDLININPALGSILDELPASLKKADDQKKCKRAKDKQLDQDTDQDLIDLEVQLLKSGIDISIDNSDVQQCVSKESQTLQDKHGIARVSGSTSSFGAVAPDKSHEKFENSLSTSTEPQIAANADTNKTMDNLKHEELSSQKRPMATGHDVHSFVSTESIMDDKPLMPRRMKQWHETIIDNLDSIVNKNTSNTQRQPTKFQVDPSVLTLKSAISRAGSRASEESNTSYKRNRAVTISPVPLVKDSENIDVLNKTLDAKMKKLEFEITADTEALIKRYTKETADNIFALQVKMLGIKMRNMDDMMRIDEMIAAEKLRLAKIELALKLRDLKKSSRKRSVGKYE